MSIDDAAISLRPCVLLRHTNSLMLSLLFLLGIRCFVGLMARLVMLATLFRIDYIPTVLLRRTIYYIIIIKPKSNLVRLYGQTNKKVFAELVSVKFPMVTYRKSFDTTVNKTHPTNMSSHPNKGLI